MSKVSPAWPPQQQGWLGWLVPTPSRVPEDGVLRQCEPTRQPPPQGSEAELRALLALPAGAEMRASVPERSYASGSSDFEGNEILVLIFILLYLSAGILLLELSPWR